MSDDLIRLLLFVAIAAALLGIISGALLRSNVVRHSPAFEEMFSWTFVRGFWVQSLNLEFLLPWVEAPYISTNARRYLFLTRAFGLLAAVAIACLILIGLALPWA